MDLIKFFLSYLTFDFDQTIDAGCQAVNEDFWMINNFIAN